ncbi:MAG: hypothetical protein GX483_08535 [Actinomycetaceae bacterium]|nr:hypothetical protein [Actinomycetaceae bacterium]
MTFRALIESLASEIAFEAKDELLGEVGELVQAEHASVRLMDRIRGSLGRYIDIGIATGKYRARLIDSGVNWVLVEIGQHDYIVPLHAIRSVVGLGVAVGETERFPRTLNMVLRAVLGEYIAITTGEFDISGELVAVGHDYCLVSQLAARQTYSWDENKSSASETYVPLAAIITIRSGTN